MTHGLPDDPRLAGTSPATFFTDNDVRGDAQGRGHRQHGRRRTCFPATIRSGSQIQIRNVPFTIVGVLATKGQNAGGQDQDDVVLVPYTTAQTRLSGNTRIGQILVSATSPQDIAGGAGGGRDDHARVAQASAERR